MINTNTNPENQELREVVFDEMGLQPKDYLPHISQFIKKELNLVSSITNNELIARVGDIIITITPENGNLSVDFARFNSQQQPDGSLKPVFDNKSIGDNLQANTIDLVHVLKKLLQYLVVDLNQTIIVNASTERRMNLYKELIVKLFPNHQEQFTFGSISRE